GPRDRPPDDLDRLGLAVPEQLLDAPVRAPRVEPTAGAVAAAEPGHAVTALCRSRRTRSRSSSFDSSVSAASAPPERISSASWRFEAIMASMRSSTVPLQTNLWTSTLRR